MMHNQPQKIIKDLAQKRPNQIPIQNINRSYNPVLNKNQNMIQGKPNQVIPLDDSNNDLQKK